MRRRRDRTGDRLEQAPACLYSQQDPLYKWNVLHGLTTWAYALMDPGGLGCTRGMFPMDSLMFISNIMSLSGSGYHQTLLGKLLPADAMATYRMKSLVSGEALLTKPHSSCHAAQINCKIILKIICLSSNLWPIC